MSSKLGAKHRTNRAGNKSGAEFGVTFAAALPACQGLLFEAGKQLKFLSEPLPTDFLSLSRAPAPPPVSLCHPRCQPRRVDIDWLRASHLHQPPSSPSAASGEAFFLTVGTLRVLDQQRLQPALSLQIYSAKLTFSCWSFSRTFSTKAPSHQFDGWGETKGGRHDSLLASNKPRELAKIFPLLIVGSLILTWAEETRSLSQGVDEPCRPN